MEKVISSGARLTVLFLVGVMISCGVKKSENPEYIVDEDTLGVDTTALSNQEYPYAAEIVEYRSETSAGGELYAIYPFEDAPHFLFSFFGKANLLILNEEIEVDEGIAIEDDRNFSAIKLLEESEKDGIVSFGKIELVTNSGLENLFQQSFTKRSLMIGESYTCNTANAKGELSLSPGNDGYVFTLRVITGNQSSELKGLMRVKGNIGYFQGQPHDATCKLIFLLSNETVQLHAASSDVACGCNVNAFKQVDFSLDQ